MEARPIRAVEFAERIENAEDIVDILAECRGMIKTLRYYEGEMIDADKAYKKLYELEIANGRLKQGIKDIKLAASKILWFDEGESNND